MYQNDEYGCLYEVYGSERTPIDFLHEQIYNIIAKTSLSFYGNEETLFMICDHVYKFASKVLDVSTVTYELIYEHCRDYYIHVQLENGTKFTYKTILFTNLKNRFYLPDSKNLYNEMNALLNSIPNHNTELLEIELIKFLNKNHLRLNIHTFFVSTERGNFFDITGGDALHGTTLYLHLNSSDNKEIIWNFYLITKDNQNDRH